MTRPVTKNEVEEDSKGLKNTKSPGTDGYAGEFYKTLIEDITPVQCRAYTLQNQNYTTFSSNISLQNHGH